MNLGPPIRPAPPVKPEWHTYERNPALEENSKGQLRTKAVPLPPKVPTIYDFYGVLGLTVVWATLK